jgi:hypothetical protein
MGHFFALLAYIVGRLIFWCENRVKGTLAFHCPQCATVRMGTQRDVTSVDVSTLVFRTQCEGRLLICQTCKCAYNFESFEAGSEGIYKAKTWDCPECKFLTPATSLRCANCGYKLA